MSWKSLLFVVLCFMPAAAQAERLLKVTMDGQSYTARIVTDEPSGHLRPGLENDLKAGPFEDAVRIGGVPDDEQSIDTAIRVLAAACNFDYAKIKDWGAYGDPVWTDPRNGEIVFWTTCKDD
ncbi:MAG: hypothetical protein ABI459_07380 [Deltaproteobacteria bacterium]